MINIQIENPQTKNNSSCQNDILLIHTNEKESSYTYIAGQEPNEDSVKYFMRRREK